MLKYNYQRDKRSRLKMLNQIKGAISSAIVALVFATVTVGGCLAIDAAAKRLGLTKESLFSSLHQSANVEESTNLRCH